MKLGLEFCARVVALAAVALVPASSTAQSSHDQAPVSKPVPPGTYVLTVATATLDSVMRAQVFTDSGRFYPCRINPACSSWGHDVVLTNPDITIDGSRVFVSVHVVGTYVINDFFAPSVSGGLILSGVPVLRDNKVAFTQTTTEASPESDMAFRAFIDAVRPRVESMIEKAPGFDLAGYLVASTADLQLPPPRLGKHECVRASQIKIESIGTTRDPPALKTTATVSRPNPGEPAC
jgi:hypothetical protein